MPEHAVTRAGPRIRVRLKLSSIPASGYILILIFFAFSATIRNFASPANLSLLISQASPLIIISVGMSMVVMTGCIDLSVGGLISMCGVIMATVLSRGMSAAMAIAVGLATGILYGLATGFVVQIMKVPSFIATFGMMGVAASLANIISAKQTIYWKPAANNGLIKKIASNLLTVYFGKGPSQVLTVSSIALTAVVVVVTAVFLFHKTNLGAKIYAVGANEEIARLGRIDPTRLRLTMYAVSGFLAAVASLLYMSRVNSAPPTMGDGLEFQAVVATIIGGNSLRGGKGSIIGAVLGALSLFTVRNALTLVGFNTSSIQVFIGSVLIVGMLINAFIDLCEKKRAMKQDSLSGKETKPNV